VDWKYLVGILGASAAWMWSVFTWHKSQAAQRNQSEYNRKEGLYRELLRTLTVFYKDGPKTGVAPFLEQFRLSWLYAPDDVVRILNSLVESLKVDPTAERLMTQEQQEQVRDDRDKRGAQRIALLVAAIRRDLFETAEKKTELTATEFGHYS
jgi:hypothetical protein